jgi:hypothetical protein
MHMLWEILITFWSYLPWVAIALMAGLALRRRKESKALLMQAVGASAYFLLGIVQFVVVLMLRYFSAGKLLDAAAYIFGFLMFLALVLFALGYCLERFTRRKDMPIEVSARPAA